MEQAAVGSGVPPYQKQIRKAKKRPKRAPVLCVKLRPACRSPATAAQQHVLTEMKAQLQIIYLFIFSNQIFPPAASCYYFWPRFPT